MATISVCMIVRNEEDVLSRILEDIKTIADEIIIVDTGSTDKTKEIALSYTSLVYDFKWCDDFAAARNFACAKANMDYWMWFDADDRISDYYKEEIIKLKKCLDLSTDVVMMKYVTDFDEEEKPSFYYYRERIIRNGKGFMWEGAVHETVAAYGNTVYSNIEIEHRKISSKNSDRNINIYENIIKKGGTLEPRHKFYYGRELYYHERYKEAADIFKEFLNGEGWIENKIDACIKLSYCYEELKLEKERIEILLYSFLFDNPRAEICCEIGRFMLEREHYNQAIYWYKNALNSEINEKGGGFIDRDYYGYIPYIQLCVCYDRLGEYEKAFEYNKLAMKVKPKSEAVKANNIYFKEILKKDGIK